MVAGLKTSVCKVNQWVPPTRRNCGTLGALDFTPLLLQFYPIERYQLTPFPWVSLSRILLWAAYQYAAKNGQRLENTLAGVTRVMYTHVSATPW